MIHGHGARTHRNVTRQANQSSQNSGSISTTGIRSGKGWGGSEGVADTALEIARSNGVTPSSLKRSHTVGGRSSTGSDHHVSQANAFAVDIPATGAKGDKIAKELSEKYGVGINQSKIIQTEDGRKFRVQLLWNVGPGNHQDHVHIGIKAVGNDAQVGSTTSAGTHGHSHGASTSGSASNTPASMGSVSPSATSSYSPRHAGASSSTAPSGSPSIANVIDKDPARTRANVTQYASSFNQADFSDALKALLALAEVADEDAEFNAWKQGLPSAEKNLPVAELKAKFLAKKLAELTAKQVNASKAAGKPMTEKEALETAKQELQEKYRTQPAVAVQRDASMPISG